MLDLEKIPDSIMERLKKRRNTDDEIRNMIPEQAFNESCAWRGLLGDYGYSLWEDVEALKRAEIASVVRSFTPEQIAETLSQARFHQKNGTLVNPKVFIEIIEFLQAEMRRTARQIDFLQTNSDVEIFEQSLAAYEGEPLNAAS